MAVKYVIWQSSKQWHLSCVDGRTDQHTQAGNIQTLLYTLDDFQKYCDENGLEYTVYPLEKVVSQKCVDTFRYVKVAG